MQGPTKPTPKLHMPENAKLVFQGVIFDVYQWEEIGYDGKPIVFEKIKRPDSVAILPVTDDGKIILIREEQPGRKASYVCYPAGRIEKDEDPLLAAKRELLEETGYASDDWKLFYTVDPVIKMDWSVYTYVAKGCKKIAEQNLDGGEKIEIMPVDFDTFIELVCTLEIDYVDIRTKVLEAKLDPEKMKALRQEFGL